MYTKKSKQSIINIKNILMDAPSKIINNRLPSLRSDTSFTLIELLVVIGILAILTAAVIIILNPAEYLKQTRDVTRMNDLTSINQALSVLESQGITNFGLANTVYVSIPDTTSTCANLGLPTLPSNYSYHCVSTSTLQSSNGTGWIPVDFTQSATLSFSSLPIDPINTTSTNEYYTYITGGSWKLSAIMESNKYKPFAQNDGGTASEAYEKGNNLTLGSTVFPSGWIRVPGNSTFGTSDFWVMKYDADCIQASNNTPLTAPDTGYHTYANNTQPCVGPNYYIASTPGGYPIANISQIDSATYCTSIGAHLITNNEWQTIAWNVQNVSSNWSSGTVGTGYIYSGHNDNAPANALIADSNDSNGYAGETNTGGNQKRTLILSNSSVVWDMAGNVWQWTNDTITGANEPTGATPGWNWREYTAITTWGSLTQAKAGPLNSSWNSSNGIGQIYSDGTASNATIYGFLRGGLWDSGGDAGVDTLILNFTPGSTS